MEKHQINYKLIDNESVKQSHKRLIENIIAGAPTKILNDLKDLFNFYIKTSYEKKGKQITIERLNEYYKQLEQITQNKRLLFIKSRYLLYDSFPELKEEISSTFP